MSKKYTSRHHKKYTRKNKRKTTRKNKRKMQMKGGNYENDFTTRTTEGIPTKPLNKFVVTVPGYGTMSAAAYKRLMEDNDRNGNHFYD
mgnify:CR=1 FL=1